MISSIWKGTEAMVQNDGKLRNDEVLWNTFSALCGKDTRVDEPIFEEFYRNEFQQMRNVCGFAPEAGALIQKLKCEGYRLVLATNPLFPAIATYSRVKWAGLTPEDFALITTYENSCHCKPNPEYYRDILQTLDLKPEECLMVGNDVDEDLIAQTLGLNVFLLTDCMINKHKKDISSYPHGSFSELIRYIEEL